MRTVARETAGLEMLQTRLMGVCNRIIDNIEHFSTEDVRDPEAVLHWVNVLHGTLAAIQRSEEEPSDGNPLSRMFAPFRVVQGEDSEPEDSEDEEDEEDDPDAA